MRLRVEGMASLMAVTVCTYLVCLAFQAEILKLVNFLGASLRSASVLNWGSLDRKDFVFGVVSLWGQHLGKLPITPYISSSTTRGRQVSSSIFVLSRP